MADLEDSRFRGFITHSYSFHTLRPVYRGKRRISVSGVVEHLSPHPVIPVCYLQIGNRGALIHLEEPIDSIGKETFPVIGIAVFPHNHPWLESEDIYCRAK